MGIDKGRGTAQIENPQLLMKGRGRNVLITFWNAMGLLSRTFKWMSSLFCCSSLIQAFVWAQIEAWRRLIEDMPAGTIPSLHAFQSQNRLSLLSALYSLPAEQIIQLLGHFGYQKQCRKKAAGLLSPHCCPDQNSPCLCFFTHKLPLGLAVAACPWVPTANLCKE